VAAGKRKYRGIEDLYAAEEEMSSRQKEAPAASNFVPTTSEPEPQPALDVAQRRVWRSIWMLEELEHPLNLVPDEAERNYGLALIKVMLGRFNEAVKSLSAALEANPRHKLALSLLGDLQFKMGNYKEAAASLEKLVDQEPDNLSAITWLCLAYHCLGDKGKALAKQSLLQNVAPDLVTALNR
jgi:tetratricopeptide (TPR) repeat protein